MTIMQDAYWMPATASGPGQGKRTGRNKRPAWADVEVEGWWADDDWGSWTPEGAEARTGEEAVHKPRSRRGRGGGGSEGGGNVQQQQPQQQQSPPETPPEQQQQQPHNGAGERTGRRRPGAEAFASWEECESAELEVCKKRLAEHLASLPGLRDCTGEAPELLEGCLSDSQGAILVFESEVERRVEELFPQEFFSVGPELTNIVNEGYLVLDIRPAAAQPHAQDAIERLARCWWALAQGTTRWATLVFVAVPAGGLEEDHESSFAELYKEEVLRAPAPLIFAAQRSTASGTSSASGTSGGEGNLGGHVPGAKVAAGSHPTAAKQKVPLQDEEEELVRDISDFLREQPHEVQELASNFAQRFNTSVRANPHSPYSPEGKNDGSFKKWLLARGFVSGGIYENNKSRFSLPPGGVPSSARADGDVEGPSPRTVLLPPTSDAPPQ